MNKAAIIGIFALGAAAAALPASAQTTLDWAFQGTHTGSGQFTYGADNIVSAFSGTYNGQVLSLITFTTDPNNPGAQLGKADNDGHYNYHGVPNTGGADLQFDNRFPLTDYGILVSTGTGDAERVYDIGTTRGVVEFFSINPDGSYVDDFGTFTTATPAAGAVPEPATWAMMILGMGAVGFAMRRRKVTTRVSYAG